MKLVFLLTYLVIVVVVLFSIWVGFSLGRYILLKKRNRKNPSLGSIVGAMLALLGFVLALTLSLVSSRYATRKQLVLDEANAIETAILRTSFLEEPLRTESRRLLIEYVNTRVQFTIENFDKISNLIADSEILQDEMWTLTNKTSSQEQNTEMFALYIRSLNEVVDLHSKRYYQGIQYRLPQSLRFLLYFTIILAMLAVGYELGISDSRHFLGSLLLALMFSAVLFIILELDRPGPKTLIPISQQPMLDLQKKLNSFGK